MLRTLYDWNDIERWIRERGGRPARVRAADRGLAIDFCDNGDNLEPISWDEFFRVLAEEHIPMVVDLEPGKRFYRFVYHS
jgi:hypothetical protein